LYRRNCGSLPKLNITHNREKNRSIVNWFRTNCLLPPKASNISPNTKYLLAIKFY
jgi:hypothetical protein